MRDTSRSHSRLTVHLVGTTASPQEHRQDASIMEASWAGTVKGYWRPMASTYRACRRDGDVPLRERIPLRATVPLGVATIVGFGVWIYGYDVLLKPISENIGWSEAVPLSTHGVLPARRGTLTTLTARWLHRRGSRVVSPTGPKAGGHSTRRAWPLWWRGTSWRPAAVRAG